MPEVPKEGERMTRWSAGLLKEVTLLCVVLKWWVHVIFASLLKCAHKVSPSVNNLSNQRQFVICNKYSILILDVSGGNEGKECMGVVLRVLFL